MAKDEAGTKIEHWVVDTAGEVFRSGSFAVFGMVFASTGGVHTVVLEDNSGTNNILLEIRVRAGGNIEIEASWLVANGIKLHSSSDVDSRIHMTIVSNNEQADQ